MSYTFQKGKYRARIKSSFDRTNGNTGMYSYSEYYPFEYEANSCFKFKTNPDVIVDLETLTAPNSTLADSGTYKGLSYKLYENNLVIVTGDQTETMSNTDESPWYSDAHYLYINANITGGYVFKNLWVDEIKIGHLGFVENNTVSPNRLFANTDNHDYMCLDVTGIDTTNTNTLAYLFVGCNIGWSSHANGPIGIESINIHSGITSITSMLAFNYFGTDPRGTLHYMDLALNWNTDNVTGAYSAFDIGGSVNLTVHVTKALNSMFLGSSKWWLGKLDVTVDTINVSDLTYLFSGCSASEITIRRLPTTTATSMNSMFKDCRAEYINILSTSGFDTSAVTSMSALFEGCDELKHIYSGNNDYIMDTSNLSYAPTMFKNCSNLEKMPFISDGASSQSFPRLYTATEMFYNCFKQTENEYPYLEISIGSNPTLTSTFEQCHFKGVIITCTGNYAPGFPSAFKDSDVELIMIIWNSTRTAGTGGSWASIAEGCTSLEYFSALIPSNYKMRASSLYRAFYGCSNLLEVTLLNLQNHTGNISTTDMLTGCNALTKLETPTGPFAAITLPKTMYYNGTAYTTASLANSTYTSTP